MKKLLMTAMVCGFVFTANAQPAVPEAIDQDRSAIAGAAEQQEEARDATVAADARTEGNDRHCLRHTGSRLIGKDRRQSCANAPGRAYTREDIERTGHTDLLSALRTLDPSIR